MIKLSRIDGGWNIESDDFSVFYQKRKGGEERAGITHKDSSGSFAEIFTVVDKDCCGEPLNPPDIAALLKRIEKGSYKVTEKEKAGWRICGYKPPTNEERLHEIVRLIYFRLVDYSTRLTGL